MGRKIIKRYAKSTFSHIAVEYGLKRLHVFQILSLECFDI